MSIDVERAPLTTVASSQCPLSAMHQLKHEQLNIFVHATEMFIEKVPYMYICCFSANFGSNRATPWLILFSRIEVLSGAKKFNISKTHTFLLINNNFL